MKPFLSGRPMTSVTCVLFPSAVRGGALPASHMLLPLRQSLQGVPAAQGPQLLLTAGPLPAGQVLRGAQQVRDHTHTLFKHSLLVAFITSMV